jgi:16S rRNA (uracil1498-N3)-methyltransferase
MSSHNDSASSRRLRRLYSNQDLDLIETISLSAEESRHALKSLRLQLGDACLIVNGKGWEAEAVLRSTEHNLAQFQILACRHEQRGFSLPVTVLPALIKKGKMDILVEKAQEFGAANFQPLLCERSDYDIAADRFEAVASRWDKIAKEAAKQSGSSQVLTIYAPIKFDKMLAGLDSKNLVLLFHTQVPAQDWTLQARELAKEENFFSGITMLIGPEGGFSQKEIQMALDCGHPCLKIVSMGNTILKADTAFVAALAGISFFI